MPQARILEPETSSHARDFVRCGFRWCRKDQRWEKNCKDPVKTLEPFIEEYPHLKTEASTQSENIP